MPVSALLAEHSRSAMVLNLAIVLNLLLGVLHVLPSQAASAKQANLVIYSQYIARACVNMSC